MQHIFTMRIGSPFFLMAVVDTCSLHKLKILVLRLLCSTYLNHLWHVKVFYFFLWKSLLFIVQRDLTCMGSVSALLFSRIFRNGELGSGRCPHSIYLFKKVTPEFFFMACFWVVFLNPQEMFFSISLFSVFPFSACVIEEHPSMNNAGIPKINC